MHKDLATTTSDLTGFAAARSIGMTSTDPLTQVQLFTADSAGVSSGVALLDDHGRAVVLSGTAGSARLTDGSTFVGYALLRGSAPSAVWLDAQASSVTAAATAAVFGDGSDGTVTLDGTTTILSMVPSANVYTAARDLFLQNLTLAAGVTLAMSGFRLFVAGTLTNPTTSVIHNNGNAGAIGTAGGAGAAGSVTNASGSLGVGTAGGAGGAGNNSGAAGTANAAGFPGGTGAGGAGGGDGTHSAAAAGAWTALAAAKGGARNIFSLLMGMIFGTQTNSTASLVSLFSGGTGGGGGGGDNADAGGGGGGGGGGVLVVAAGSVVNGGTISANGAVGGAGFSTAHNAGGGGGGGGGVAIVLSRSYSGNAPTATGGAGGAKVGSSGVVGSAGAAGVVLQVAV